MSCSYYSLYPIVISNTLLTCVDRSLQNTMDLLMSIQLIYVEVCCAFFSDFPNIHHLCLFIILTSTNFRLSASFYMSTKKVDMMGLS